MSQNERPPQAILTSAAPRRFYLGAAQAKQSGCRVELEAQAGGQGTTVQTDPRARAGEIPGTAV